MFGHPSVSNSMRRLRGLCWAKDPDTADQSESGAALVEFTVLMPFFFLVLFGIVEFGSIIWSQNTMTTAAREGARAAAVQGGNLTAATQKACATLARSSAAQTFTVAATDVCTVPAGAVTGVGEVTVNISVSKASASLFNTFFSYSNGSVSASTWNGTLAAGATMRREDTCAAPSAPASCFCNTAGGTPAGC